MNTKLERELNESICAWDYITIVSSRHGVVPLFTVTADIKRLFSSSADSSFIELKAERKE